LFQGEDYGVIFLCIGIRTCPALRAERTQCGAERSRDESFRRAFRINPHPEPKCCGVRVPRNNGITPETVPLTKNLSY